jgi:hypothetical protein
MGKFAPEILEAVKEVGKNCQALNVVAITGGYNNDLFDAALRLHDATGYLIEALEQNDENMDPARTKLPNLDEVFAGDPVSEYVDAIYDYASGKGTAETVRAATKKLADQQKWAELSKKDEEEEIYEDSIEGFAKAIMDHNNLTGTVANDIAAQLVHCFGLLEGQVGPSVGFKAVTPQGAFEGTIYNTNEQHIVVLKGKEYGYARKYDGFCSEYPVEPVADQEELFNQLHPEKDTKDMSLSDYVTEFGFGKYDPNELLEVIQGILDRRGHFSKDDYKLIRFYLKQKPFNDPEEINTLSDRALELAWKKHKYARNFM